MNNTPSYEVQASYGVFPFLRAVTYSAKNPKPITSQSVNTATTIVGVFISQIAPVCIEPGRIILKTPYL
jgi:uncharacterized protein YdaL